MTYKEWENEENQINKILETEDVLSWRIEHLRQYILFVNDLAIEYLTEAL